MHRRLPWQRKGMLRCERCWCVSDSGRGWFASVGEVSEDGEGPLVTTYCPPCAQLELDDSPRDSGYV